MDSPLRCLYCPVGAQLLLNLPFAVALASPKCLSLGSSELPRSIDVGSRLVDPMVARRS